MRQGHTNREVAALMYLSEKTVERHLSRIFAKLEINNRAALADRSSRRTPTPAVSLAARSPNRAGEGFPPSQMPPAAAGFCSSRGGTAGAGGDRTAGVDRRLGK